MGSACSSPLQRPRTWGTASARTSDDGEGGTRSDLLAPRRCKRTPAPGTLIAMRDTQVRDNAVPLFVAGHESTATTLARALREPSKHPEFTERFVEEADAYGDGPTGERPRTTIRARESLARRCERLPPPATPRPKRGIPVRAERAMSTRPPSVAIHAVIEVLWALESVRAVPRASRAIAVGPGRGLLLVLAALAVGCRSPRPDERPRGSDVRVERPDDSLGSTAPRPARAEPDPARCEEIAQQFVRRLEQAPGTCATDRDCACFAPVHARLGCGGVTDAETARALNEIQQVFRQARCPWPRQCAPYACTARCVAGRCGVPTPTLSVPTR
jgi:hypothetical protein